MEGHSSDGKDSEKKHRGRFMGKLFREKKTTINEDDVDDFLRAPSDKLHMMPTSQSPSFPPRLSRIDTASARRWPSPADIPNSNKLRRRSASPKRARKGLIVRFTDAQPEIIGEGGDEATSPVTDISLRIRAHSHPPIRQPSRDPSLERRDINPPGYGQKAPQPSENVEIFRPGTFRRTQTGFQSIPDIQTTSAPGTRPIEWSEQNSVYNEGLKPTPQGPTTFSNKIMAEMQAGEGRALVKAASDPFSMDDSIVTHSTRSVSPGQSNYEIAPKLQELYLNTAKNMHIPPSPGLPILSPGLPALLEPGRRPSDSSRPLTPKEPQITGQFVESPAQLSKPPILNMQEAASAVGDDALHDFSQRVVHLFTLFRLSTESVKPLPQCSLEELVRAAMWWFLKGRMNLEATIRDRPSSPQAQQINFFLRQQAYADLAKSLWIIEIVTSQFPESQLKSGSVDSNTQLADVLDCRQGTLSSLRKLIMSMKRNNFLPPPSDDAPLPQGLDSSIWVQDDGNRSLVASQRQTSILTLSETYPLGDTAHKFHYARLFVEAVLVEEAASQHYRCPVLISIVRGQIEHSLTAIVASQDGSINLSVQSDKTRGLTWEDVRWQSKRNTVEINLPRGFILRLQASEQEYRTLWGIYDYEKRTHSSLHQRQGEELVFETVLQTFQYFEPSPQSGIGFPKEPQPYCRFRLFEKTAVEKAATGPRTMHQGYRIGLNTSSKTKNLSGIDQELPSTLPIQFGFLRGEGGMPAFLLKFNETKLNYTIVCTFDDVTQRARLHTLLTGIALGDAEEVVAEGSLKGFSMKEVVMPKSLKAALKISFILSRPIIQILSGSFLADSQTKDQSTGSSEIDSLKALQWQNFRVINQDLGDVHGFKSVLSEHLRVILDFKAGTLTDRVNVAPGELKFRLDVNASNELKILRQTQQDLTISVSEAQVSKELPQDLALLLESIARTESCRIYTFPSTKELHLFQAALTGFIVLFDGLASSFNISRRRMVVPIYKKWDAATTRLQIVQKEKVIQLVAFFENFSHGDCMNLALKSTDLFESSHRSGKFSLRIVDAKFAMPKAKSEAGGIEHQFACLDMPEYPGEHDDITIVFETEADREVFAKSLPAPVKIASRMPSVRR